MLFTTRKLTPYFAFQTREGDAAAAVEARNTEILTRPTSEGESMIE